MAKRSTSTDRILIDPIFGIPNGAEDSFAYSESNVDSEETTSDDLLEIDSYAVEPDIDYVDYDDGYDEAYGETLETPSGFVVLSQTLRRAPGGQQVVDIVIEVPDVDGARNYEIEVAKV